MDFLIGIIITGCVYTLPVILFRKITNIQIKSRLLAGIAVILYGSIYHVTLQHIFYGEVVQQTAPVLWVLVCFYFLNNDEPIFFKKKQPTAPESQNVSIDEDGTIIIEQPEPKQKYKAKKKLKILVASLIVLLLSSIALNGYLIYQSNNNHVLSQEDKQTLIDKQNQRKENVKEALEESDNKSVYYSDNGSYYHSYSCEDTPKSPRIVVRNQAEILGYKPCPKCQKEIIEANEKIKQQNDEKINRFGDPELAEQLEKITEEAKAKTEANREQITEENKETVDKIVKAQMKWQEKRQDE